MIFRYRAYGLDLESRSGIESLVPGAATGDSTIRPIEVFVGPCPLWAGEALKLPATPLYPANANPDAQPTFQLQRLGTGEFFHLSYADGTQFVTDSATLRIWGDCPAALTSADLVTYLLGPVMGFVLRRRGVLALHASCFSVGSRAFAICGGARTGKSTTVAALALRGNPVLCEDIAAVREREASFHVASGYPRINLWPDSVAKFFASYGDLPKITHNWDKRFLPLDGHPARFESQERPLAAIYVLAPRSDDPSTPRIEDVSPQDAALLLVQNTYMNYLLDKQQRAEEFDAVARLLAQVPVRRLTPSSNPGKIAAMCELLESAAAADGDDFTARSSASRPG